MKHNLITILGPTAAGKTRVAAHLAADLGTEIISGDSRQVYRSMDLGTGKDLDDYIVNGIKIPYHLIDIVNPGYKYNVFEFQRDFYEAFTNISTQGITPILCGGSGLYIESVLREYEMSEAPLNQPLRDKLEKLPLDEIVNIFKQYKQPHNTTDTNNKRRTIRAIEIAEYERNHANDKTTHPKINSLVIGIDIDRNLRRENISKRLKQRLEEGMIDEIKGILATGVNADDLIYYGLEYKYITLYVIGQLSFEEMFSKLEIAIHQFAKRQMTWFRGMERRGIKINWINATLPMNEKIEIIKSML